eukprot:m.2242 g.2242  ORF g.2242 m.2242 type:complete len:114 (+) comp8484_c0_seq2:48-389(+)
MYPTLWKEVGTQKAAVKHALRENHKGDSGLFSRLWQVFACEFPRNWHSAHQWLDGLRQSDIFTVTSIDSDFCSTWSWLSMSVAADSVHSVFSFDDLQCCMYEGRTDPGFILPS